MPSATRWPCGKVKVVGVSSSVPQWDRERQSWYLVGDDGQHQFITHEEADQRFGWVRAGSGADGRGTAHPGTAAVSGGLADDAPPRLDSTQAAKRVLYRHDVQHALHVLTVQVRLYLKYGGFLEMEGRTVGDELALLHSEVSEALDCYRKRGFEEWTRPEDGKPEGFGVELADVLIRLLDTAARYDVDLYDKFVQKMRFNWTRPYRHGNPNL